MRLVDAPFLAPAAARHGLKPAALRDKTKEVSASFARIPDATKEDPSMRTKKSRRANL